MKNFDFIEVLHHINVLITTVWFILEFRSIRKGLVKKERKLNIGYILTGLFAFVLCFFLLFVVVLDEQRYFSMFSSILTLIWFIVGIFYLFHQIRNLRLQKSKANEIA